jgi:tetratricopeptide (TPR) repeat protein
MTVLGRMLMRMHEYSEALRIWEGLSALNPDDGHNWLQIARCCRSLRLVSKGLSAAEHALRIDPGLDEASEIAKGLRASLTAG